MAEPKFQQQHFNILAAQFRRYLSEVTNYERAQGVTDMIVVLADRFALDNPKFKREKWMLACIPGE